MRDTTRDARQGLLDSLRLLSDDELVARLKGLAARERRATAILVAHLAELDTRDVHLRAGYSSLFTYCRDVLALSEHEAYNRIEAARTARRFPVVLDLLAAGEVNLTTVRLLGPHLTAENHAGVLESARRKRKADVEEIVAGLSPRAEVPASVRKLPELKPALHVGNVARTLQVAQVDPGAVLSGAAASPASEEASPPALPTGTLPGAPDPLSATAGPAAATATPPPGNVPVSLPHQRRGAEVTPLSPDRYRYQVTIAGSTLEKLRLAKDMLRHVLPSGDDEAILDRALTALLADLARKRFGAPQSTAPSDKSARPAGRGGAPASRHVPALVKRAVWVRDLGRCAFVGTGGHRCGERGFLEFHHVRPYAVGGEASVENVQLRCRRHNGHEARVYLARELVTEREPAGKQQGRVRTGARAWTAGKTDGSSRGRSGTSARDHIGAERAGSGSAC